jgi:uncharacterized protein YndB with AHSA1/START domain
MHSILIDNSESVRLTRVFPALPEAVFRAWTEPDEFRSWWRPSPYETVSVEIDARVGGPYRVAMRHPDGREQHLFGTFLEVEQSRRLSLTWRLEGTDQDDGYEAILTVEFRACADGTEMRLFHDRLPAASAAMYSAGWTDVLGRLAKLFG